MEDDRVPFATAPVPSSGPAGLIPPPPQQPILVTGQNGQGIGALRVAVIAVVVIGVMALSAVGFVTYLLLRGPGRASTAVVASITARAKADYPDYTVLKTQSVSRDGTITPGFEMDVFVWLRNVQYPGFEMTAVYRAPASRAATAAGYENGDEFFKRTSVPQPAGSFIAMWLDAHPGVVPYFVSETGSPADATRTYEVSYQRQESNGGRVVTYNGTYYYEYAVAADHWTQTDEPTDPEPAADALDNEDSLFIAADGSIADTQAMVAQALPGFAAFGVATTAQGEPLVVVRSRAYPGLVLAADPLYLDPPDRDDGIVALFGTRSLKGKRFAAFWTARHPGTIVDYISSDPDSIGDSNAWDVTYVQTLQHVDDMSFETDVFLRWNPKTQAWAPEK